MNYYVNTTLSVPFVYKESAFILWYFINQGLYVKESYWKYIFLQILDQARIISQKKKTKKTSCFAKSCSSIFCTISATLKAVAFLIRSATSQVARLGAVRYRFKLNVNSKALAMYCTIRFTSLCKIFTYLSFQQKFSVPCAPLAVPVELAAIEFVLLHYSQFHRDRQALIMVNMAPKSFC